MEKKSYKILLKKYPILFCQASKSMRETCMCWGIEADIGWYDQLDDLFGRLELMNLEFYPKYRTRIQAEQVKEKFGTLRVYNTIISEPNPIFRIFHWPFDWIAKKMIHNIDFGIKYETMDDAWVENCHEELSKDEYEDMLSWHHDSDEDRLEKVGDKYIRYYKLHHGPTTKSRVTKHRFLHFIKDIMLNISFALDFAPSWSFKRNHQVAVTAMSAMAEELIHKYEDKCYDTCEHCGSQIGTDWSPRCETTCYITYICKNCAEKDTKHTYYMNGALYSGKDIVKTKEEVDKERAEIEAKFNRRKTDEED